MMKKIFGLILMGVLLSSTNIFAQNIPRDTSFTIKSSLLKEQKKFPFITVAEVALNKSVLVKNNLVYKNIGDRMLHLDVLYPKKKSKNGYPAVILIHGGGWRSGDRSQTTTIAKKLAASGYVAVSVEYRLSLEAKYPASLVDIREAIRWMRIHARKYHINQNKIATMGFSSGGQIAALLGTTNGFKKYDALAGSDAPASDVQAVIDVDGILAFKHPESAEGTVASIWLGGTYEEQPALWEEASALYHTDKNSVPILFLNSSTIRFHAGRNDMISKLNSFGIYSEFHEFPNTPHPFWFFNPWFNPMMDYTIKFLDHIFKS